MDGNTPVDWGPPEEQQVFLTAHLDLSFRSPLWILSLILLVLHLPTVYPSFAK